MALRSELLSVGCNRTAHALQWEHTHNIVCYAAGPFIAVYKPKKYSQDPHPTVKLTLRLPNTQAASEDSLANFRINAIQIWIMNNPNIVYIAAGATDNLVHLFELNVSTWAYKYLANLSGHQKSVIALSALKVENKNEVYLASASADSVVRVYHLKIGAWDLISESNMGLHGVQLTLELFSFRNVIILLTGGVDALLRIFHVSIQYKKLDLLLKVRGHENWIRSIRFCSVNDSLGMLASCDQDGYIRIWRLQAGNVLSQEPSEFDLDAEIDSFGEHGHGFSVDGAEFSIVIDSVVEAHEDWVCDLDWHPRISSEEKDEKVHTVQKNIQPMRLLSASMDQTMSIWEPDSESGIWLSEVHVGEVGGHSKLGFVNCKWGPNGFSILSSSFNGSLHHWRKEEEVGSFVWNPELSPSGHFDAVRDACWDSSGAYLLTVGKDQTTRAFAKWESENIWAEIGRPQVHGYDMYCITSLASTPFRFVSGAEEKVIRIFDSTISFLKLLKQISGLKISDELLSSSSSVSKVVLPELGLSNKATESKLDESLQDSPPLEEELLGSTLFPEVNKLYGHGYELYSLASNSKGTLLASACVAKHSQSDHAAIIVWNTSTWKEMCRLPGHTLTVVQMEFSHDDRYLLSVSRDRQFFVYDLADPVNPIVATKNEKAHSRIIWSCSWSPSDLLFATGSRDKSVKVWSSKSWTLDSTLPQFSSPVTAVAFAPLQGSEMLAVGIEEGLISLHVRNASKQWNLVTSVDPLFAHSGAITRLTWNRPRTQVDSKSEKKEDTKSLLLASVSEDSSVRIFSYSS